MIGNVLDECSQPNEFYTDCGSYCISTCQNRQFANCIDECKKGCFCKDGYLRDMDSGKCVLPKDCFRNQRM